MSLKKKIQQSIAKRQSYLNNALSEFDKQVIKEQSYLFDLILKEYLPKFQTTEAGVLIENNHNYRLISELEQVMDDFQTHLNNGALKTIGRQMLHTTVLSADYYAAMGIKAATIDKIIDSLKFINQRIGITDTGQVIKGSYLYNLGRADVVRQQTRDYVLQNLTSRTDINTFTKGFKELLEGSKDVNGELIRYMKTYVHDTLFETQRSIDKIVADRLELNNAVYLGSEIKTTREFCSEHLGKLYTREEIEEIGEGEWQGKKDDNDIFRDMGGYNCRHQWGWLTDEAAEFFKEQEEI